MASACSGSPKTQAVRPYIVPVAISTASSSCAYGMIVNTGPKISSWAIVEFGSTLAKIVG
jgi:hypothetical protein